MARAMEQPNLPPDEPPLSGDEGERHSRERIARPTPRERVLREARRLFGQAVGSPRTRFDRVRRLIAPLIVAIVPFYWVADASYRTTLTTVGRDQGIFQYIAWAVLRGDVDYRDVRDVNGPLVHLVHMVMLKLGGRDEQRFHVIDIVVTSVSFAIVGLLLPGIVSKRAPRWSERACWGIAAWVALAGQYALYLYWNQAQRESFCDWFLLPSIALQIARPPSHRGHDSGAASRRAREVRRVILVAALSTITWFCKPSFLFFTVMQFGVMLADRDTVLSRWSRAWAFVVGGVLGAVIPCAYLLRYGDPLSFLQITLHDVPRIYRFIWARSAPEILGDDGPLSSATLGLAVGAILTALVVLRALPRRMLALALAPLVGILVVVAQHKGFGYHFHPLTATTHIGFLVIVLMLWERFRGAPRARPVGRFVALGAAAAYAFFVASNMKASPHTRNVWILGGGETPEKRSEQEWFDTFKTYDFFPWDLRQSARYLADHTKEDARVQVYGMDPYLLFLAGRRSATPYIYAYDLNADAALDGGWHNKPNWIESERIRAARAAHERDMLGKLREAPPEAFVFIDRSPLMSSGDAWEDFRGCCSESARWVATHYHPARTIGEVHVWFRDDMPVNDIETWTRFGAADAAGPLRPQPKPEP